MLKTASVGDVDKVSGIKVLVSRTYPRYIAQGMFNFHLLELAPSAELLKNWQENHNIEYYKTKFFEEMRNIKAQQKLKDLRELSETKDVILFCYEPEGQFCHRHLLFEMIESQRTLGFKMCTFFCSKDNRCYAKRPGQSVHTDFNSSGKSKSGMTTFARTIGNAEFCDFYGELSGNLLKQCLIFCEKTHNFTCRTCFFDFSAYICLLSGERGLRKYCESYVEKQLRLGSLDLIAKIKSKQITTDELKVKWGFPVAPKRVGGGRVTLPDLTPEQMKKILEKHPEIKTAHGDVVIEDEVV